MVKVVIRALKLGNRGHDQNVDNTLYASAFVEAVEGRDMGYMGTMMTTYTASPPSCVPVSALMIVKCQ